MSLLSKLLVSFLLVFTISSQAEELTLSTEKGFVLKADYYQPQVHSKRAVILLHQCNLNRTMYDDLGRAFMKRGIHAISMDFRSFGESIDESTDVLKARKLPKKERQKAWDDNWTFFPSDVQLAYDFLRKRVGINGIIGAVGASCGGVQVLKLAERNPLSAVSFFSSAIEYNDLDNHKTMLVNKPTLFISAEKDGTYKYMHEEFAKNKNKNSKFISYKGKMHGYPLFAHDMQLAETIVNWFDTNLAK